MCGSSSAPPSSRTPERAPGLSSLRVIAPAAGKQPADASDGPRLSGDGRYAAFTPHAPHGVPGDTGGQGDRSVRHLR
jgi:hypothetical protein